MGDDVVSTYLRRKLRSSIDEAEQEPGRPSSIISLFRSLEKQMEISHCGIPVDVLYEVMEALSECRVFSYERPAAKKGFLYLLHVLHRPLSLFLFKRKMIKQLNPIGEKLRSLSSAAAPRPPVVPQTTPFSEHWDIIGFEEQAAQIEAWLTPCSPSSRDTFIEIAIAGKWGCGKTALAQKVFAIPTIENSFSPLIWVCLSGIMPEQEQEQEQELEREEEARVRVVKCIKEKIGQDKWDELNGKRYLIVLDNASWPWPGGLNLDLPKGSGAALILTTRHEHDLGVNHVIRLEPRLSDHNCWQIFSNAAHQQAKLDPDEPLLSAIRYDVKGNTRGRALAVKTLGTIIPDWLIQRKHWIRARDLSITWGKDTRYWKWSKLPPPEETEEAAELLAVCWFEISGIFKLKLLLVNRSYSAYLVYKLKEQHQHLDVKMSGSATIIEKNKWHGNSVYLDGDHPGDHPRPRPWAEGEEWMEIKLGEFVNDIDYNRDRVRARLFQSGPWKSGLVVKGISFRLSDN